MHCEHCEYQLKASEGLNYLTSADGTYYTVVGGDVSGNLVIPGLFNGKPVKGIESSAFKSNRRITGITLAGSLEFIGADAFADSSLFLSKIIMPEGVQTIGANAFARTHLAEIKLPASLKILGNGAFQSCPSLERVTLSEGLEEIGDLAFAECGSLAEIEIPDSVKNLGVRAFYKCRNLKSAVIGDGVQSLGDSTFYECENLFAVRFGDGLTQIGDTAFAYCEKLENVVLPENLKIIGRGAFNYCTGLKTLECYGVTTVKDTAFGGCHSLTTVKLPSAEEIWQSAFEECTSLNSVSFSTSLRKLSYYCFARCNKLQTVYFNGTVVQWSAVEKDTGWLPTYLAYTVKCTDGNTT